VGCQVSFPEGKGQDLKVRIYLQPEQRLRLSGARAELPICLDGMHLTFFGWLATFSLCKKVGVEIEKVVV